MKSSGSLEKRGFTLSTFALLSINEAEGLPYLLTPSLLRVRIRLSPTTTRAKENYKNRISYSWILAPRLTTTAQT